MIAIMKKNKLVLNIRSVLLNDWDPVGIGDNPNLSDEYDGYIGSIINILKQKPTIEEIVGFLGEIEKTELGINNVDVKYLCNVATKLQKIGETIIADR